MSVCLVRSASSCGRPDAVRRSGRLRRHPWNEIVLGRFGVREQHRLRLRRCGGSVAGRPGRLRRAGPPRRDRAAGRRGTGVPQRHGRCRRRSHPAGRGVVGESVDRVRDRGRRAADRSPGLGRDPRAAPRRDRPPAATARSGWPTSAPGAASGSPRAARSWTASSCRSRPSTAWWVIWAGDRRSTSPSTTSAAIPRPARPGRSWQCSWSSLSPPRPDRSSRRTRTRFSRQPCSGRSPRRDPPPSRS